MKNVNKNLASILSQVYYKIYQKSSQSLTKSIYNKYRHKYIKNIIDVYQYLPIVYLISSIKKCTEKYIKVYNLYICIVF